MHHLIIIPVYNEARYVLNVINGVKPFGRDVMVVNDGSTDGTSEILADVPEIILLNHPINQGYGIKQFSHLLN